LNNLEDSIRIEFAVFNKDILFVALVGSNDKLSGVYRSANGGNSWTVMGDSGFGDTNPPDIHPGGQGYISLSLAVNPQDSNDVYVGGDAGEFLGIDNAASGHIEEWDGDWDQITGLDDGPHPDSREMVFDAGGNLLESDDGGISRRVDHDDWVSIIGNLGVTEINSVAYDAISDKVFAGAQDNSRVEEVAPSSGMHVWDTWSGGDGGNFGIGYVTEGGVRKAIRYGMGNNFKDGGIERRVYTAGNNQQLVEESNVDNLDSVDSQFDSFHQFPFAVNSIEGFGDRIMVGGHSLYESSNYGDTLTNLLPAIGGSIFNVSAVVYGGKLGGQNLPDVFVASMQNAPGTSDFGFHLFFRSGAGAPVLRVSGPDSLHGDPPYGNGPNMTIKIVVDPDDWRHIYVTNGVEIYYTQDITSSAVNWQPIVGTLNTTRLHVGSIRTLEIVKRSTTPGDDVLLVGADSGVFVCRDPHTVALTWHELGANLPNALVNDLHYIPFGTSKTSAATDNALVAGTLGRGTWLLKNALKLVTNPSVLNIVGDTDPNKINDTIRPDVDPSNKPMLNVSLNSTGRALPLAAIEKIVISGRKGLDKVTLDFADGTIPFIPNGIEYDGGDSFDTLAFSGQVPPIQYQADPDQSPINGTLNVLGLLSIHFKNVETVNNVAPTMSSLQIEKNSVVEGDQATASGSFIDPGILAGHSVVVDWGGSVMTTPLTGLLPGKLNCRGMRKKNVTETASRNCPRHIFVVLQPVLGLASKSTFANPLSLKAFSNSESWNFWPSFGRRRTCCFSRSMVTLAGSTHGRESSAFCARGFHPAGQCIPGTEITYSSGAADVVLRSAGGVHPITRTPIARTAARTAYCFNIGHLPQIGMVDQSLPNHTLRHLRGRSSRNRKAQGPAAERWFHRP
jgi:hypothetical protein